MCAEKKLTERKRENIIEAAVTEFRANGFSATSMDRIAATANVSKRTVYNHFASKQVLFQNIAQALCDQLTQVSQHPYDPDIPLKTQLHTIAEQEMAMLTSAEFISTFKMITSESLVAPELTRATIDNFQESSLGVVTWIKQATKDGKLSVCDPVRAGKQFLALIETFALWPQLYDFKPVPNKSAQKTIIAAAIEMFINTYELKTTKKKTSR
ncbi:MAG: TetR/AcrR family transcriptional regulator [Gammaproteobacteria bacterium]|nr:MAG: TetR/AcrR family transcriptional regulator [Gammaproteobacteria bacterium]